MCIHSVFPWQCKTNLPEVFGRKVRLRYTGALLWSFWLCGLSSQEALPLLQEVIVRRATTKPHFSFIALRDLVSVSFAHCRHGDLCVTVFPALSSKAGFIHKDWCSRLVLTWSTPLEEENDGPKIYQRDVMWREFVKRASKASLQPGITFKKSIRNGHCHVSFHKLKPSVQC